MPGDNDDEVAARGILYLLIFQQLGQLVRWSWGYHVLLAPPEAFEGESEHANSQIERGRYRDNVSEEEDELLGESSETVIGSSEEEVAANGRLLSAKKSGASSPHIDSDFESGEQTPITRDQYTSSVSSRKSSSKHTPPLNEGSSLLQTPANGNLPGANSSDGDIISFPSIGPTGDPEDQGGNLTPSFWMHKFLAASQIRLKNISRCFSAGLSRGFQSLPISLQHLLTRGYQATQRFLKGAWDFMNPPLWAMLAAIIVASIPSLQRLFFTEGTFIQNSVTRAVSQSGGVAIPLILVVLGANLANNTTQTDSHRSIENDKLEKKLLYASIISRMILPFVIMAPMLALAAKYVPISILDDPIFVIVCFLLTGAPSALQLAQICQINGVYEGVMSRLLFQSYVIW